MVTDTDADALTQMMYTDGWNKVVKPWFANRANSAIKALCIAPEQREGDAKGLSDDALRSRIRECEYLLFGFQNEVTVNRMNRQREALAQNGTLPNRE
jgi:hypothetical protein